MSRDDRKESTLAERMAARQANYDREPLHQVESTELDDMHEAMDQAMAPVEGSPKVWERREDETDQCWGWFQFYRSLGARGSSWNIQGNRTIKKMYRQLKHWHVHPPRRSTLERWAAQYEWDARAKAYDAHMDRVYLQTTENSLRIAARRHVELAVAMQDVALPELRKWIDSVRETAHRGDIKVRDLVRLVESGVKLERLVRGQSTEATEEVLDLEKLTLEELRQLKLLKEKARKE